MFKRDIIGKLSAWAQNNGRKPLILRGARQVGKTTAVNMFSNLFDQYIYLNLELKEEKRIFEQEYSMDELIRAIFFYKDQVRGNGKV
nr:AAA family ATPase [Desulfobacula sp.]